MINTTNNNGHNPQILQYTRVFRTEYCVLSGLYWFWFLSLNDVKLDRSGSGPTLRCSDIFSPLTKDDTFLSAARSAACWLFPADTAAAPRPEATIPFQNKVKWKYFPVPESTPHSSETTLFKVLHRSVEVSPESKGTPLCVKVLLRVCTLYVLCVLIVWWSDWFNPRAQWRRSAEALPRQRRLNARLVRGQLSQAEGGQKNRNTEVMWLSVDFYV